MSGRSGHRLPSRTRRRHGAVTCSTPRGSRPPGRDRLGSVEATPSSSGGAMAGSVIVAGARTPIGRLLGGLKGLSGRRARRRRDQGRPGEGRRRRRPGRLRDHGPGAAGRRRPDHRPPGRGQGRHPDERPVDHHQQGLPVRPERDRARRPADPRRRVRRRRGRRHGVDDQRAAPAAEVARGLQVRRRDAASTRWPTTGSGTRSPTRPMGALTEQCNTAGAEADPRGAGRVLAPARTSGRGGAGRTASSTTRSSRSRSRSARATRSSSTRTRASAPTPRPSRWPSCAPPSARTARSPPARPRRSPTAPARSW